MSLRHPVMALLLAHSTVIRRVHTILVCLFVTNCDIGFIILYGVMSEELLALFHTLNFDPS